jgi:cell wall-associated NlpC family hydrolase
MSFYFEDAEAVHRLRTEAAQWRGTGFYPYSKAKGGGVDCVGLCEALLSAAGAIPADLSFPRAPADYSRHVHNDKILNYLRGNVADDPQSTLLARMFAELPKPERKQLSAFRYDYEPQLMPGDVLILKGGVGIFHMPVMLSDRSFIQSAYPDGVSEGDIGDSNYEPFIVAVFRARAL